MSDRSACHAGSVGVAALHIDMFLRLVPTMCAASASIYPGITVKLPTTFAKNVRPKSPPPQE